MLIKFLTPIAGLTFSHKPGDEVEWRNNAEAVRFIQAGLAVAVRTGGGSERATAPAGKERATPTPAAVESTPVSTTPPAATDPTGDTNEQPAKGPSSKKGGKDAAKK